MNINVIGLGYMGLPMALVLANSGHQVHGTDTDPNVISALQNGDILFQEQGLPELFQAIQQKATFTCSAAPQAANVFLVAVPTPLTTDNAPNMTYVEAAAAAIAPVLSAGNLIVLESTSPIGATDLHVKQTIENLRPDLINNIHYAFCPERAMPGNTLHEIIHNDRCIGGLTPAATAQAKAFYATFIQGELIETNSKTAELAKLVENAYRDVNIAFANELSVLADTENIDVFKLINLANRHPRVNILQPAAGVGGHCIAIDPVFITHNNPQQTPLMQAARAVNNTKPQHVAQHIIQAVKQIDSQDTGKPVNVGILGLAYKPNVEDTRESPALHIVNLLKNQHNMKVMACEPHLKSHVDISLHNLTEILEKCVVIAILTAHDCFKKQLEQVDLSQKMIIDPCGLLK